MPFNVVMNGHRYIEHIPEEVGSAVQFSVPGEAALGKNITTIGTTDTFGVPRTIQNS